MNGRDIRERLSRRARRAGLTLQPDLLSQLQTYYSLLAVWNRKINLTGLNLDDPTPEAIDRLLVEPLVAAKYVPDGTRRIIDIGSGGGSPAIPFALAVPGAYLVMVESKMRKSVFLREVIRVLGMDRAEVLTARFEELLTRPDLHEAHDLLTIRAVRIEAKVLMTLQAFVRPGGQLFLFRGSGPEGPPETVPYPLVWCATYPLVESLRSRLVILEKRRLR